MVTTIISIALSSIIAFFIAKWQMKKNKIVHFSINSYDIGKGLSDEFPEFKLHFGDDALADNVMVLKGGFMNTGRNDINGLKGENDIKLILPDECNIKAYTISSTEDLIVTANKDDEKENILNFGVSEIFKTDEYFKYTVIVEASKEIEDLYSELKFRHRISNTDKIGNTYIGQQRNRFRKKLYIVVITLMILMMLSVILALTYQKIHYKIYQNNNEKEVEIHIDPYSNIYVDEDALIPFFSGKKITPEELEKEYKIVPITKFNWRSSNTLAAIFVFIFSFVYFILVYYLLWGRNSHIINVIRENEENKKKNT